MRDMENRNIPSITDLHTHILPHMDDGSPDVQTSLQMLEGLAAQGVKTVCATAHYYAWSESVDEFLKRRESAWRHIKKEAEEVGRLPQVFLGAEVAYFPGISRSTQLEQLCLGGTRTLLLELSYTQWTPQQVEEVACLSLDHGYQVVLAHPERFSYIQTYRGDMRKMLSLPIVMQINADSLLHWRSRRLAIELLGGDTPAVLASDCHNLTTRPPRLVKARQLVEKKLGADLLTRMDLMALRLTQPTAELVQEGRA